MCGSTAHEPSNLEQLLDQLARTADTEHQAISIADIIDATGSRSFSPLLLMAGVLIASPLGGIPVLPTLVAVIVALVSAQMLMGRKHFWLPQWILKRSVEKEKVIDTVSWLRRPARFIDRLIKPRFTGLIQDRGQQLIALVCILIAVGLPVMELIPFSALLAGVALTAFGLALVSYDGALVLLAYFTTLGIIAILINGL